MTLLLFRRGDECPFFAMHVSSLAPPARAALAVLLARLFGANAAFWIDAPAPRPEETPREAA